MGQLVMWSPDRTRQPGSNQRATARSAHARRTQEDAYAVDFIILEIVDDTRALEEAWRNCCPLTSASAPAQDVNAASASWWQCDFSHEDARCLSQLDVLQATTNHVVNQLGRPNSSSMWVRAALSHTCPISYVALGCFFRSLLAGSVCIFTPANLTSTSVMVASVR